MAATYITKHAVVTVIWAQNVCPVAWREIVSVDVEHAAPS